MMKQEFKEAVIAKILETPAGRKRLADAMTGPGRIVCQVCGEETFNLLGHADRIGDDAHVVMKIMSS